MGSGPAALAPVPISIDGGDACCGPDLRDRDVAEVRPPWWKDPPLLPSATSGVVLVLGFALEWSGLRAAAVARQAIALASGAYRPGATGSAVAVESADIAFTGHILA